MKEVKAMIEIKKIFFPIRSDEFTIWVELFYIRMSSD